MKLMNRLSKRTPPQTAADCQSRINELEAKLRTAESRKQEIKDQRGRVFLEGSDSDLATLQSDATSIEAEIETLLAAIEIANGEHQSALRREREQEIKRAIKAAKSQRKKLLRHQIRIHDLCVELQDCLVNSRELSRQLSEVNQKAHQSGCKHLTFGDPTSALAWQTGQSIPMPEHSIQIQGYWPMPPGDHVPVWSEFKNLDLDAYDDFRTLTSNEQKDMIARRTRESRRKNPAVNTPVRMLDT